MSYYTFNGTKIITKEIKDKLPKSLINYLWKLVDNLKTDIDLPMDYLQVFEIKTEDKKGINNLLITHIQEVPPYVKIHLLKKNFNINGRIYIIDDVEHVTMLWSYEY